MVSHTAVENFNMILTCPAVAMTRAKRCLCIVGDSGTVGKGSKFLKHWMDWLEEHADVRVVE